MFIIKSLCQRHTWLVTPENVVFSHFGEEKWKCNTTTLSSKQLIGLESVDFLMSMSENLLATSMLRMSWTFSLEITQNRELIVKLILKFKELEVSRSQRKAKKILIRFIISFEFFAVIQNVCFHLRRYKDHGSLNMQN